MGDPTTLRGFGHWFTLGLVAGGITLLVATFIPTLLPARIASVKL